MIKPPHRNIGLALATLMLFAGLTLAVRIHSVSAVDCVGRLYGYPGCPVRGSSSSQSVASGGYCGNAIVDDGEDCDKGRFNGKTDCSNECKKLTCGDGVVTKDIGEECEPITEEVYVKDKSGNITTELHFGGTQCGWFCQAPVCNDAGVCTGGCKLKYIPQCASSSSTASTAASDALHSAATSSVAPAPVCGNNTLEAGEECDDGNRNPIDACNNDCKLPKCSDGIVQNAEECDDGNKENTDNCTNDCKLPRCGDGIHQKVEQCDDGVRNSDSAKNACRTNCTQAKCGDGTVDANEQCDEGINNADTVADACRTSCKLPVCGDGTTDAKEECDDANTIDTDACTSLCKKAACGDGIAQTGEECDWGLKNSNVAANACRTSCHFPRCGDGVVDTGEQCDTAGSATPLENGGTCAADCKIQLPLVPAPASSVSSSAPEVVAPAVPAPEPLPVLEHPSADASGATLPSALAASGATVPLAAAKHRSSLPIALIALAAMGILSLLAAFLMGSNLGKRFGNKGKKTPGSIDDIPLDQIEMPWHKW